MSSEERSLNTDGSLAPKDNVESFYINDSKLLSNKPLSQESQNDDELSPPINFQNQNSEHQENENSVASEDLNSSLSPRDESYLRLDGSTRSSYVNSDLFATRPQIGVEPIYENGDSFMTFEGEEPLRIGEV